MAYSVDSSWYLDDIVGIGIYIKEDKDFMRRRMLNNNNNNDDLVDEHTRFLMRFDNNFKVDGYPPPNIEDGLSIKGGEFTTDSTRTGYKYTNTSSSYGMIHTSSVLSSLYFHYGDPFTVDFWYKPLAIIKACSVGHEWRNGCFCFGIADEGGLCLYFATYEESYRINAGNVNVGKWYHVAMARDINNKSFCFIDGILVGQTPCRNYPLRSYNIYFNIQMHRDNRGSFVIDNFRISDVARWVSNFDPPK